MFGVLLYTLFSGFGRLFDITMSSKVPRKCTLCFEFDKSSRKVLPSSLEIHNWIVDVIGITTDQVHTAYYDTDVCCFFVKLLNPVLLDKILMKFGGEATFRHRDSSVSTVLIYNAEVDYKNVRVFNLPPEVENCYLKEVLTSYGDVKSIRNELWSKQHRLQCFSGVRSVEMHIRKNIPSNLMICGYKARISYEGQVGTCFLCNESGHERSECPNRAVVLKNSYQQRKKLTIADLVANKQTDEAAEPSTSDRLTQGPQLSEVEFPPLPSKPEANKQAPATALQPLTNKRRRTSNSSDDDVHELEQVVLQELQQSAPVTSDTKTAAAEVEEAVGGEKKEHTQTQVAAGSQLQLPRAELTPSPAQRDAQSQVEQPKQERPIDINNAESSDGKPTVECQTLNQNKQGMGSRVTTPTGSDTESDSESKMVAALTPSEAQRQKAVQERMDTGIELDPPKSPSAEMSQKSGGRKHKTQPNVKAVKKKLAFQDPKDDQKDDPHSATKMDLA